MLALALVSVPAVSLPVLSAIGALLCLLTWLSRVPASFFLERFAVILPFVILVGLFIPFLPDRPAGSWSLGLGPVRLSADGTLIFLNILAKAVLVAWTVGIVIATTGIRPLLDGLARLRVPTPFILTTAFAYRYLFLLIEEADRMKRAAASRAFRPRSLSDSRVIGHIIGMFFLRSYERAERVYQAMSARGFDPAVLRPGTPMPLRLSEFAALAGAALFSVWLFLMGRAQ